MKKNSSPFRYISIYGLLVFGGCASQPTGELNKDINIEPTQLPQELRDQFEIKDISEATPKSTPAAPVPTTKKQKATDKAPEKKKEFSIPNRRPKADPIWVGEKATYDVTYFGVLAGEFSMEAKPYKVVNGRKVYHIFGYANSSRVFSMVYSLDDSLQSFIDYEGLFSHRFELKLNESKQARDSLELYDSEKKTAYYWDRWHHHKKGFIEKKEIAEMVPFSQDVISSLYYVRGKPLNPGDRFTFPVVSEGKSWEAVINVDRREELKTPIGRMKTIVVRPEMKFEGVIKQQGDSFIWLTDDDRRHVLRVEAKVKIGAVVATIRELEPGTPP